MRKVLDQRKTNNSILVLATLGVFLGLVLIGAAPQVLAQAAMTREFNVKDEIEHKDDLDTKPDIEKAFEQLAGTVKDVYSSAEEVTRDHDDLLNDGNYAFSYYISIRPNGTARYLDPGNNKTDLVTNANRYFVPLRRLYDSLLARSDDWHSRLLVQFVLGRDDATFTVTIVSPDDGSAAAAASAYQKALERKLSSETNLVRSTILRSTEVTAKDDKVLIVTHFPRAGLDPLLAADAK